MTTNYTSTFIAIAPDSPTRVAVAPPDATPTVASLQYELIAEHPYECTSDDVLFDVYATRAGIAPEERDAAREAFFAKSQACMRASPLTKRYGWGIHHDEQSRVALVPSGTPEYEAMVARDDLDHKAAMCSSRRA